MELFHLLYAMMCVGVLIHNVRVLYRMNARTQHARRIAFVTLAFGAVIGLLESLSEGAPATSFLLLLLGVMLLAVAGIRTGPRDGSGGQGSVVRHD
jgi:hypothetical protein